MKKCPTCDVALAHEMYEQTPIDRCPQCRGVFLSRARLEMIRHRRDTAADDLKREARDEFRGDTRHVIRCPRCRGLMDKRPLASRFAQLTLDVCRGCDGVWLDGGELALAQLVYEASTRGRESQEFQRRMAALAADPARRQRFEEALARLPEELPGQAAEVSDMLLADFVSDLVVSHTFTVLP